MIIHQLTIQTPYTDHAYSHNYQILASMFFNGKPTYSDTEIVEGILKGGTVECRITKYLYKKHLGYVYRRMDGQAQCKCQKYWDAYHDALEALVRIIARNEFNPSVGKISTLLHGIYSKKCIDQERKENGPKGKFSKHFDELTEWLPDSSKSLLDEICNHEDFELIYDLLGELGERARGLIMDLEYFGYSLEEAARRNGYKNAKSASQARFRIKKKLREMLRNRGKNQNGSDCKED